MFQIQESGHNRARWPRILPVKGISLRPTAKSLTV